ncbi:Lrp/AsnC family transcriptional regulator [Streptomyces sp. NPDC059506]|uniref:Lrp/AsnC family transcriptional regulator n=1 Tax=Streptomyces TaxID=1883 RepID=UPI0021754AD9|nr:MULTISPECIES: Lrp/AsnC family transcriptional regulator [unclassified Streptomyces]MCZ2528087.1 Lrp/AsnC family transcriptional regulator [Streptomyces sp. HB2AG]
MPNEMRPAELDETDRRILRVLARDARTPNNAIAAAVGIAPSTCLGRIRALRERGIVHGHHTDIDLAALGLPLQAMIAVRLGAHTRGQVDSFLDHAAGLPGVISVFNLSGGNDFLLRVAASSADALRDFILDHITSHPGIQHTETSLIFTHRRGAAALSAL